MTEPTYAASRLIVKFCETAPMGMVTTEGAISAVLLVPIATLMAPAALDRVIVQLALAPGAMVVGLHTNAVKVGLAKSANDELRVEVPRVAETMAEVSVIMLPAVAPKVPVLLPAEMVIAPGMATKVGLLLESVMSEPPEGAALERATVQEVAAPEFREVGLQTREETTIGVTKVTVAVFD